MWENLIDKIDENWTRQKVTAMSDKNAWAACHKQKINWRLELKHEEEEAIMVMQNSIIIFWYIDCWR